jgi:2-polyprenyl-3-methyl-5-hydroxy-6-metoxy-1,4-benzoquinol methylase
MTTAQHAAQTLGTCALCGATATEVLASELRRGKGEVHYCAACDYGFLVDKQVRDAKAYYAEEYRREHSHNADATSTHARELYDVYVNFQSDRLREIVPVLTPKSRVMEVGASSGQFLVHIKDRVDTVQAIELDRDCCAFLTSEHGIEADTEFLEKSRFANERYDVVCAFQVMENVDDPVAFLRTLTPATKPGGLIYIEVPNLRDPLLALWDVPTYRKFFYHSAHLHYFTEKSLRQVAVAAGFAPDAIEVSFTQDYNLLNHLHWIMNNGPQADCMVGLSEVNLPGADKELSTWLTSEMKALNERYVQRLVARKSTSNMMMKIRRD